MTDTPSPGPWYTDHEHEHVMVFGSDKIAVADCAPYYANTYQAVREANARLIVAAPDYHDIAPDALDVIEALLLQRPDDEVLSDLAHRLRAAIAKAEGQT